MRPWIMALALVLAGLGLAACAAEERAAVVPAEWEQVLQAAKREGKVAVLGPGGSSERKALTEAFKDKYGIAVEFTGLGGREQSTRVETERKAGQYLWDVFVGGNSTLVLGLKPQGALDPIEPLLILPEVKDPKKWKEGRIVFAEKDKLGVVMTPSTRESLYINTKLAKTEEFKTYKALLDPKWKGKILALDPRTPGPGQSAFSHFYLHPDLGPDFVRALAKQELKILEDERVAIEWLATGRYPILIGETEDFRRFKGEGLPVADVDPRKLKEGGRVSSSIGQVAAINRAPHPNAARVYINWLLSKEGQTQFAKLTDLPSWRADVPWKGEPAWAALSGTGWVDTSSEEALVKHRAPLVKLLKEVLKD